MRPCGRATALARSSSSLSDADLIRAVHAADLGDAIRMSLPDPLGIHRFNQERRNSIFWISGFVHGRFNCLDGFASTNSSAAGTMPAAMTSEKFLAAFFDRVECGEQRVDGLGFLQQADGDSRSR